MQPSIDERERERERTIHAKQVYYKCSREIEEQAYKCSFKQDLAIKKGYTKKKKKKI